MRRIMIYKPNTSFGQLCKAAADAGLSAVYSLVSSFSAVIRPVVSCSRHLN